MKRISNMMIVLILLFFQYGQVPASYANEHNAIEEGADSHAKKSLNKNLVGNARFHTAPNDTGITLVAYGGAGGHVDIPAVINGQPVTIIGESSFFNKNVTSVTIPESVTKIGDRAFLMNQITTVTLPNRLESIGNLAFFDNRLSTVYIPDSVKIIGAESFANNQLTAVTIPDGITRIENSVFSRNKLESVTIPSSVTSIGNYAFYQNHLTTIILPDDLKKIGFYTFYGNNLKEVTIPEAVTYIEDWAFASNQLHWVYFNRPLVLQPNTFNYQGDRFDGWYSDLAWAKPWDGNVTQPTKIYAKGNALTYTLTFEPNSDTAIDEQQILVGEKALAPATPIKDGSQFIGWYKDEELTVPWNFDTDVITGNITLYGKWAKKPYTVIFHTDTDTITVEVLNGELLAKPSDPTKVGYTFAGWYKDDKLMIPWNFEIDKVTESMTLYGKWLTNEYIITFYTNGGTVISPVTAKYNEVIDEPLFPTKTGYKFVGWYKNEELTKPWSFDTDKVVEDTALYAKWEREAVHYILDFASNGGSAISPQRITANTTAMQPINPIKVGYTFAGWYKDAHFTKVWNFHTDIVTANTTLYAKWQWLANDSSGGGGNSSPTLTEPETTEPTLSQKPEPKPEDQAKPQPTEQTPQTEANITFSDIPQGHWAWTMIQEMARQGIITGYQDGSFKPNAPIQRQHVALMLTRALELEPKKEAFIFEDIPESHLYFEEIKQVQQAGLFDGIDGNFQPKTNMTRSQLAKVLVEALNLTAHKKETFNDVSAAHWAYNYIAILASNGITIGDQGNFRPNDAVTRAEFAIFLYRALSQ
nr:InlB B-repeat-containing protein [Lysinibacillus sphaericus]